LTRFRFASAFAEAWEDGEEEERIWLTLVDDMDGVDDVD
jgi:hypothetical protein